MTKRYYEWSMLALRVSLGVIFLAHGLQKIGEFEGIVKFFAAIGLPAFMPYVVTAIETLGGACLILGLFTRVAALGIILLMMGAIVTVKFSKGFLNGYEFDVSLLAMAAALVLSGSNTLSLGKFLGSFLGASSNNKAS